MPNETRRAHVAIPTLTWLPVALGLVACGGEASTDTDADGGPETYPSTFTDGKYRTTSLTLMEQDTGGRDLDNDGEDDNNLPTALTTADTVVSDQDLSPEGFNAQIATAIEAGDLILLADATYTRGDLQLDMLSGTADEAGTLSVDASSFDPDGVPLTRLLGVFDDQTGFTVETDAALLPIPFIPGEPPSLVPLQQVRITGTADPDGMTAVVTGVIPAEPLANDVLADLIPEEGVGNLSKEQLLRALESLANLPGVADIALDAETRAVSCAFELTAETSTWTEAE